MLPLAGRQVSEYTIRGSTDGRILPGQAPLLPGRGVVQPENQDRSTLTRGSGSVLGISLRLGTNASAALGFFTTAPGAFTEQIIKAVELFAEVRPAGNQDEVSESSPRTQD